MKEILESCGLLNTVHMKELVESCGREANASTIDVNCHHDLARYNKMCTDEVARQDVFMLGI